MSQAALSAIGAETEQATAPEAAPTVPFAFTDEDLRRAFEAFGTRLPGAEEAYVTEEAPAEAPANEFHAPVVLNRAALATIDTGRRTAKGFPDMNARRLRLDPRLAMRALQAIDWLIVFVAAELAANWCFGAGLLSLTLDQALAFAAAAISLKAGLWLTDAYGAKPADARPEHGAGGLALGAFVGVMIATFLAPDPRAAAALSALMPLAATLLACVHAAYALWIRAAHKQGAFSEVIVLIGATDAADRFAARARATGEARIVAIAEDRLARAPGQIDGVPVAGTVEDLLAWEGLPHVDRIVIAVTQKAESRVRALIEKLRIAPNRIDLLLDYQVQSVAGKRVDALDGAAMACVSGRPGNLRRAALKRAQDLVIGSSLLVVFAPVMALIALAVRLDSKGPVFYRQRRHGFNNRVITVLKFRSMRHDPAAPLQQVQAKDPRVTRIGGFLRRTSLDELPQLFNVLSGDMSLVGPRPHAVGMRAANRNLDHIVAEYAHRHRVKPGITGWAQINGSRGPIETPAAVRERVKLDLDYVSRASLWLDLWIMLRTAPALLGDRKATR